MDFVGTLLVVLRLGIGFHSISDFVDRQSIGYTCINDFLINSINSLFHTSSNDRFKKTKQEEQEQERTNGKSKGTSESKAIEYIKYY